MLDRAFDRVYTKFKLHFYRAVFARFQNREASLTTVESFCMEIINALENNKRGIYGGAIGYIDFTGNMDTCIAIRIAYQKNGRVFVRSGAGIVADSVPEQEFEECMNKARASLKALELAQEAEL